LRGHVLREHLLRKSLLGNHGRREQQGSSPSMP
jgi:hypothetical protein